MPLFENNGHLVLIVYIFHIVSGSFVDLKNISVLHTFSLLMITFIYYYLIYQVKVANFQILKKWTL